MGNLASDALGPLNEFIIGTLAQKIAPVMAGAILFMWVMGKLKNAIEARRIRHTEPTKYICEWMTEEEIKNLIEECRKYEKKQVEKAKNQNNKRDFMRHASG